MPESCSGSQPHRGPAMPSLSQEGWGELWPLPERAFPERGTDSTPPPPPAPMALPSGIQF